MKAPIRWFMWPLLPILLIGCDPGSGPDSLSGHREYGGGVVSDCLQCHSSENAASLDPLVTNGSGTLGKHRTHVTDRGIACERCHLNYINSATHANSRFETGIPGILIVNFDITGPAGAWVNDTGPRTGQCSAVACHGTDTPEWYGTSGWTLPACTVCHSSAYSSALDPALTNGTPPNGRHEKHVTNRGIACERCHWNYPGRPSHANGLLDTPNSGAYLVFFSVTGPTGTWVNDTGPQTGGCSSVACHGTDTPEWYGTAGWTLPACTICHSSSYSPALDPVATNGDGLAGKHLRHVNTQGIICGKCHAGYPGTGTHANGLMDTQNPAVAMVRFDITNPSGTWENDTGPQLGDCSSLACHGTDTLGWYEMAEWTLPPCATCHSAAIGARRQILGAGGDFASNPTVTSRHVAGLTDPTQTQCLVCHEISNHGTGTVRLKNADTGAEITYDPVDPSTLETFCLGCHDPDGAVITFISGGTPTSPFNDGAVLGAVPYIAGSKIKESWEKQYGHRRKGLTCLGTGSPGTGCHGNYNTGTGLGSINAHGSGNAGLLANKLTLPVTSSTWNESRYKLCLDCHAGSPSLLTISQLAGVADGGNFAQPRVNYTQWPYTIDFMLTGFHDYYSYNMDRQYNLHLYHLIEGMGQWYYRGDSTNGISSCVTCHNVHGVDGQNYYLWDEWSFSTETVSGTEYGKVANGNFGYDGAGNWIGPQYPDFCNNTCHWDGKYRYPRSPFNEAKAVASRATGTLVNGDTVTIYFSDSTNGPVIDETNIDTVLAPSGATAHSWVDSDKGVTPGQLTAAWSSTNGKTSNVLTITIFAANSPTGDPTIAVGDSITFNLTTITDTTVNNNPIRGKMTLRGSP